MISDAELIELEKLIELERIYKAQNDLLSFTKYTFHKFQPTWFHQTYYRILDLFAKGKIRRLMITVPPQHGKSEGSTRRLPAFMFGVNPDAKLAVASYNATLARKFNRDIQRIVDSEDYNRIFPQTRLNNSNVFTVSSNFLRNADEFEIVGHEGGLKAVGRGGALTGNPVDVMIMDDLYKDYAEGNSPTIRDNVIDWYTTVVRTRLHNNSSELIVFTRWHEEDLIGFLEKREEVITANNWADIENADQKHWIKINFEAIKTGEPTELDPRQKGEPLYPERQNIEKLIADRAGDNIKFECLYQGNPTSAAGLLYGSNWKTYITKPDAIVRKNYTDTADTGDDYLCSIDYDVCADGLAYIVDIRYTNEPMEVTEPLVAGGLMKNKVHYADIESNNGGRGFARKIQDMCYGMVSVSWFHQGENKESRVITKAATVKQKIVFPDNWSVRWPEFYIHVINFKRKFSANKHDDAPDCLTGIIERMDFIDTGSLTVSYDDL